MQTGEIGIVDAVAPTFPRLEHKVYLVEIAHRTLPFSLPEPEDEGNVQGNEKGGRLPN